MTLRSSFKVLPSSDQPLLFNPPLERSIKCSRRPETSQENQKIVIAVVANVAAFDLCGSSQNVGTEVKSS